LLSWIVEEKNCRDIVVEEGVVMYVLKAMQAHQDDQMVQCNGAATLCWLIHTGNPSTTAALAANTDGIATVLQTMDRYIANPFVFGNSACILSGVLIADPTREDIARTETIQLALLGMKLHEHSSKVHRNCLTLLRLLTTDNTENTSLLLDSINAIHRAMKTHPEDAGIQAEACGVLANICYMESRARAKLSEAGYIETVVSCQLKHRGNVRVQQAALWFHSCILHDTTENNDVSAFGGGLHIFDSMLTGVGL
jgi:hypothetical protein